MSDYMFMLESHLSPEQNHVVAVMESVAAQAGARAFLAGGALRDMMGGFPIRDLDFTIEGNAAKVLKLLEKVHGVREIGEIENRRAKQVRFTNGVVAEVAQAHVARYGKPGRAPEVRPADIRDDLLGRDFTVNSVALSLNRGSRGLLLDPTNGLSDLERRELRANSSRTLWDDPSRILRMFRLKARMSMEIDERTLNQYASVREAGLEKRIPVQALVDELRRIADEPHPEAVLEALDREKLLAAVSPALTGSKLNTAGFARLQKLRQSIPFGVEFPVWNFPLFLSLLTEKLTPKERAAVLKLPFTRAEIKALGQLEQKWKKLEKLTKSPKLNKASRVWEALRDVPGEEILYLLLRSNERLVQDRVRNYLHRLLPMAQEVTDAAVAKEGLDPGSAKFRAAKDELIRARLDARVKKAAQESAPPAAAAAPGGRREEPAHGLRSHR